MTNQEFLKNLLAGKKMKKASEPQGRFIKIKNDMLVDHEGLQVDVNELDFAEYEVVVEKIKVYQWCFFNSESGDWVLNPTLMTEEKAKQEFEKAGIENYFKTSVSFNVPEVA